MKLNFSNCDETQIFDYNGDISTYNSLNQSKNIKEFISVTGKITLEKIEDVFEVEFKITSKMIVLSSISNDPFEYTLKFKDKLSFSNSEENADSKNLIYQKEEFIDVEDLVYSLIVANLPIKLHKKGEKYPKGDNYEVMSEDEYYERLKSGSEGSPFDVLKDINFDEADDK